MPKTAYSIGEVRHSYLKEFAVPKIRYISN